MVSGIYVANYQVLCPSLPYSIHGLNPGLKIILLIPEYSQPTYFYSKLIFEFAMSAPCIFGQIRLMWQIGRWSLGGPLPVDLKLNGFYRSSFALKSRKCLLKKQLFATGDGFSE